MPLIEGGEASTLLSVLSHAPRNKFPSDESALNTLFFGMAEACTRAGKARSVLGLRRCSHRSHRSGPV